MSHHQHLYLDHAATCLQSPGTNSDAAEDFQARPASNYWQRTDIGKIPGLRQLWEQTYGDPSICIAVLDGPVDRSHPCFNGAVLSTLPSPASLATNFGAATLHGTSVASIIFSQHESRITGIAPRCKGLVIPIFQDCSTGDVAPCSQTALACAILQAVNSGANIINISGGEPSPTGYAAPELERAIEYCDRKGVILVAAAGNLGCHGLAACDCVHVPGAVPSVLAVGAMNQDGVPLNFSNCGPRYQSQGVLAIGENIPIATPGGGTTTGTGTSFAAPIVTGVVGLLMSLQRKLGNVVQARDVYNAIIAGADNCHAETDVDCRRVLAGRLNILRALSLLNRGGHCMPADPFSNIPPQATASSNGPGPCPLEPEPHGSNTGVHPDLQLRSTTGEESDAAVLPRDAGVQMAASNGRLASNSIAAQACNCKSAVASTQANLRQVYAGGTPAPNVLAFGRLGYDFETEAKRDAISRALGGDFDVNDPAAVARYFHDPKHLPRASSFVWTVVGDNGVPACALQPQGAFAEELYRILVGFLHEQEIGVTEGERKSEDKAEFVAIAGNAVGDAVLAFAARRVPVVQPDYDGMRNLNVPAICGAAREAIATDVRQQLPSSDYELARVFSENVLAGLYDANPALAVTSPQRAQVYVTVDVGEFIGRYFATVLRAYRLEAVSAGPSSDVPRGRDYQDVRLSFFNIEDTTKATITQVIVVDVTDVNPRIVAFRPLQYSR